MTSCWKMKTLGDALYMFCIFFKFAKTTGEIGHFLEGGVRQAERVCREDGLALVKDYMSPFYFEHPPCFLQYGYPPDRRSIAAAPAQTLTPQSLQGKTVSITVPPTAPTSWKLLILLNMWIMLRLLVCSRETWHFYKNTIVQLPFAVWCFVIVPLILPLKWWWAECVWMRTCVCIYVCLHVYVCQYQLIQESKAERTRPPLAAL